MYRKPDVGEEVVCYNCGQENDHFGSWCPFGQLFISERFGFECVCVCVCVCVYACADATNQAPNHPPTHEHRAYDMIDPNYATQSGLLAELRRRQAHRRSRRREYLS